MFIVISHFKVEPGWRESVAQAFLNRPHLVEKAPGFIRMEVLQQQDDLDQFWLYTTWKDSNSFDSWRKNHPFKDFHVGMPKGLKIVGKFTDIKRFNLVCD